MSEVDRARKARARQGEQHPVVVDHDGRCRSCGRAITSYTRQGAKRWRHAWGTHPDVRERRAGNVRP